VSEMSDVELDKPVCHLTYKAMSLSAQVPALSPLS